jgi:hypothetical protein
MKRFAADKDKSAVLHGKKEEVFKFTSSGDINEDVMRQISIQAQDIRAVKLATDKILQMLNGLTLVHKDRNRLAPSGSGQREDEMPPEVFSRPSSPKIRQEANHFMPQKAVESKIFNGGGVLSGGPEPPTRRKPQNGEVQSSHISAVSALGDNRGCHLWSFRSQITLALNVYFTPVRGRSDMISISHQMMAQVPWTSFLPSVGQQGHDDSASGFAHRLVSNSPALQSPFIAAAMGNNKPLPPGPPGGDRV